jgi:hypothetical protein
MKHLKEFENNISWNSLEIGDFIIDKYDDIGVIIDLPDAYIVKVDFYDLDDINTNFTIGYKDINYHGTKEEMEIILQANKFNL